MTKKIKSVEDLLDHINLEHTQLIYRGQSNIAWPGLPSIARFDNSKSKTTWNAWEYLEEHIIEDFKKKSLPYLRSEDIPGNHFEWLILAQHHGIPTRLLDWTTNPLKALFFAVEDINSEDDGVLWESRYKGWWNSITETFNDFDKGKRLAVLFPDHSNHRIVSQEGCFTVFPLPEEMKSFSDIDDFENYTHDISGSETFVIPFSAKSTIRLQLRKLGISHQSIYPGLDGLCTEIRRNFDFSW